MSWDNVLDVKNIKIWTDYSDSTQGHLFVNDNHQLKLNVGISFTLDTGETEGPTEDEVHSALSLINNQDSGPLKYLSIVEAGRYTSVYDPNHVSIDPQNDIDDGIYDFVFTYYVSSPSNLNAEIHSESVALRVEYSKTNDEGTTTVVVKETSAKGNYYTKTCVNIICYSKKLYGKSGQHRINLKMGTTDLASTDYHIILSNYNHEEDSLEVQWLYIDDSYFKIYYLEGGQEPDTDPNPGKDTDRLVYPYFISCNKASTMWDYIKNSHFPNIKCGEFDYTVQISVTNTINPDHYWPIFRANVIVHQKENQVSFIHAYTKAEHLNYNEPTSSRVYLNIYDQFGNSAYVVITSESKSSDVLSVS